MLCWGQRLCGLVQLRHVLDEQPGIIVGHPAVQLSLTIDLVNGLAYLHGQPGGP